VITSRCYSVEMDKHKILVDAKTELERHVWGTFVEGKASVALEPILPAELLLYQERFRRVVRKLRQRNKLPSR